MRTVTTVRDLRDALAPERAAGRSIGLVPTMGSFHDGHLSLVRRAREACDVVVVSLFLNPTQFGPAEDLAAYPRDESRDRALAEAEGVDLLFAPPVEEVYPEGFDTTVTVGGLTSVLEGDPARRGPGHFAGVATVVTKLFNMVGADVAYFGQKDAQQAAVVEQLVRDLAVGVEIRVLPTVRDTDGVAVSSRNAFLSPEEREAAATLPRALFAGQVAHRQGEDPVAAARVVLYGEPRLEPDYLELARFNGRLHLVAAARAGRTRLIDNVLLEGEL
jgi:pantoate--beta-alanine ligase